MFKYLTITQKPKKTSIWHTFIEKKTHFHPQTTSGPPICFGAGWTSLGRWLKNNGGAFVVWGWKWGFFSLNVCQMDVFFGFRVMVKHLITLKKFFTTSRDHASYGISLLTIIHLFKWWQAFLWWGVALTKIHTAMACDSMHSIHPTPKWLLVAPMTSQRFALPLLCCMSW